MHCGWLSSITSAAESVLRVLNFIPHSPQALHVAVCCLQTNKISVKQKSWERKDVVELSTQTSAASAANTRLEKIYSFCFSFIYLFRHSLSLKKQGWEKIHSFSSGNIQICFPGEGRGAAWMEQRVSQPPRRFKIFLRVPRGVPGKIHSMLCFLRGLSDVCLADTRTCLSRRRISKWSSLQRDSCWTHDTFSLHFSNADVNQLEKRKHNNKRNTHTFRDTWQQHHGDKNQEARQLVQVRNRSVLPQVSVKSKTSNRQLLRQSYYCYYYF